MRARRTEHVGIQSCSTSLPALTLVARQTFARTSKRCAMSPDLRQYWRHLGCNAWRAAKLFNHCDPVPDTRPPPCLVTERNGPVATAPPAEGWATRFPLFTVAPALRHRFSVKLFACSLTQNLRGVHQADGNESCFSVLVTPCRLPQEHEPMNPRLDTPHSTRSRSCARWRPSPLPPVKTHRPVDR